MSEYRVVSEGVRVIDPDGLRLPGLCQVPVWQGDHMPTVPELRQISAEQADIETQAKVNRLATGDETEQMLEKILGEEYYVPSHWPLLVQRRRLTKFLGYQTLGTVRVRDLLTDNDEDFTLAPYWRHTKTKWSDKTPEQRSAAIKLTAVGVGASAALVGEFVILSKM